MDSPAPPRKAFFLAVALAFSTGLVLHLIHADEHEAVEITPLLHWLRDSALAAPTAVATALLLTPLARAWIRRAGIDEDRRLAGAGWAALIALGYAVFTVPGIAVHGWLFGAEHEHGSFAVHAAHDGAVALFASLVFLVCAAMLVGAPWEDRHLIARATSAVAGLFASGEDRPRPRRRIRAFAPVVATAALLAALLPGIAPVATAAVGPTPCTPPGLPESRTTVANVVALDQAFYYNRIGASNPGGMIYALARDVVVKGTGELVSSLADPGAAAGNVMLRPDKRARPLVLRANVGTCLEIHLTNLLTPTALADQPADRHVGIHINGVQLVGDIASDGAFVGKNAESSAAPGETKVYTLYAEHENTYGITNPAVTVGGEGGGGTTAYGLFGALNVEPWGSDWYRSQVTRVEMDMAAAAWTGNEANGWVPATYPQVTGGQLAVRLTPDGQPVLNYDARYPIDPTVPGFDAQKQDLPLLNMLDGHELVHSDLNAIIAGPVNNGFRLLPRDYPRSYWQNQVYNMDAARGAEPFREFTTIFHDEIPAVQAFPDWFNSGPLQHALHGVRDGFAINYGTGGIGAEIIANRLGLGPMWDCVDCKYEEFFLSAWAVGDPATIVDVPANQTAPGGPGAGLGATVALYPDDPSNVHHSYINDRVKYRNLNIGPKEHHIFHLHSHQWTFSPNTEKSAYLDSQGIGPGSGYTYEIANGGTGNRNKVVGDSIFHCHFYPHFAQGMWELWRAHDTFERGTVLDATGKPVPGSRAQPDGEIAAGTPIPGIVPLPGRPMAPMPDAAATVVPYDLNGDGLADSSQVDSDGNGQADFAEGASGFENQAPNTNPGYPFFIPGVAGHRPPTPPLDMAWDDKNNDGKRDPGEVYDGGLPRHVILDGTAEEFHTTLDFNKKLLTAKVGYVPETGTPTERVAMGFHGKLWHDSYLSDAGAHTTAVNAGAPLLADPTAPASRQLKGFETNGLPPAQGAPYAEPCRTDPQPTSNGWTDPGPIPVNRTYKAAAIQLDVTLNKAGWHFPQERILSLNADVGPTLTNARPPEPLVMRLDVNDCATYWHTNLVPNVYELDDYQVRTPTDVIGQHIHLVKFDVTSADGSGNGFNYEDGTLSPQEVRERIDAVRSANGCTGDGLLDPGDTWTAQCPLARLHPYFGGPLGSGPNSMAWGARTTIQKWYADPLMNNAWDKSLGSVFTHDHFGPSTHQQVGLYSTVLVEPEGSKWRDPETGAVMGSRSVDGGPTSWRADVYWDPASSSKNVNAYREFYLEFADFQHAYQAGGGALHKQDNGAGVQIPTYADFKNAINPSFTQEPPAGRESDLYFSPNRCPNGDPRPCAEAISAADVGTFVVNYRNEPIGLRVFNPSANAGAGGQTAGDPGDLSRVFESRTDRAIAALNSQPSFYPALVKDMQPGDPFTPLLRTYMGDKVRLRMQVGATEETHNATLQGIKWLQDPLDPNSGWRNSQMAGISEYFNLEMPVRTDAGTGAPASVDYFYTTGASTDDIWNGAWGIIRGYGKPRKDLLALPNNVLPSKGWAITNASAFDATGICPKTARTMTYNVTAVRAADVIGPNGLVYNGRTTAVTTPTGTTQGSGPLIDPTALMYVNTSELLLNSAGQPTGLKAGTPIEPLVLRAAAGDCIKVTLTNKLPAQVPELPGFSAMPPIVHKDENVADGAGGNGIVTFNANDLRPSSLVGLNPQLVAYNTRQKGGLTVGGTKPTLVAPGGSQTYMWYAGDIDETRVATGIRLDARPVEYGAINLMPSDRITGSSNGLVGALVVEPPGATWTTDAGTRTAATVSWKGADGVTRSFRDFVAVLQDDVNLRYAGNCMGSSANLQCAVPDIASEKGFPEDAEDSGQKAFNYGADPLWFRLGLSPETPFTGAGSPLLNTLDAHAVYSNGLVGGDPEVPVFTVGPADPAEVRFRLLQPGGHGRDHVFSIDGHVWQREPYLSSSDRANWTSHDDPTTLNVDTPTAGVMDGHNMASWFISTQEGVGPTSHFDFILPYAGGRFRVAGDYLFRDSSSFGNYNGLWGIIRYG